MEKGDRIGAILSADEGRVWFLGFGTYEGRKIPPDSENFVMRMLHEVGIMTPALKLDSGEYVYGCECYWGEEKKVKKVIGDRKIIQVKVPDFRNE